MEFWHLVSFHASLDALLFWLEFVLRMVAAHAGLDNLEDISLLLRFYLTWLELQLLFQVG